VIPNRHGDGGWHDYRPENPTCAIALWSLTHDEADRERVERIRAGSDWTAVDPRRGKGEYNHAAPWYAYIRGEFPGYPDAIMAFTYEELHRRLSAIRDDNGDPAEWDVHHWQDLNPVATEALVQLTLGAPQTLYHGGLLHCPLRYFDPEARRPGLPEDVAARVEAVTADSVEVRLANLHPLQSRAITLWAGAFGEHEFTALDAKPSADATMETPSSRTNDPFPASREIAVHLPPGAETSLRLGLKRYQHRPSYARPWDR
jgi:hypothetical protein